MLADRVERRVGDLGEELAEVVEEQPGSFRQHRDRGVGPHRADRLGAVHGHRLDDPGEFLGRVAEGLLATGHRRVRPAGVGSVGQVRQGHE